MTYENAVEYIKDSDKYGSVLGLANITELLSRLTNPQNKLKTIHIAGTNGKGSTGAFVSSILGEAGYRVGRYISPVVFSYREIIQIESKDKVKCISEEAIASTMEKIIPHCQAMVKDGLNHPTSFEIETAMTFLYLLEEQVDFLVLETGLGGRLDATNVVEKAIVSVLTPISMDHMAFLGDSLEEIAREKLGIIKEGTTIVTADQDARVLEMIKEKSVEKKCKLVISDPKLIKKQKFSIKESTFTLEDFEDKQEYNIQLLGSHQVDNAFLAINIVKELIEQGNQIENIAIEKGLYKTQWRGRFELISKVPPIIIDGAHNLDAAEKLKKSLDLYFKGQDKIFIMGIFMDKDYKGILKVLGPMAKKIITIKPPGPRGLDSNKLAKEAANHCEDVVDTINLADAADKALKVVGEGVIVACGSLSVLKEITEEFKKRL